MTITVLCYEEIVDTIRPGDRVEVVGIYRANSIRINPTRRTVRSIFRVHLDAVSFNANVGE